jgi:hypothetical protein
MKGQRAPAGLAQPTAAEVAEAVLGDAASTAHMGNSAQQAASAASRLLTGFDTGAGIRALISSIEVSQAATKKLMDDAAAATDATRVFEPYALPTFWAAPSYVPAFDLPEVELAPSPLVGDTARVADGVEALIEVQTKEQQQLIAMTAAIELLADRQDATLDELRKLRTDQRSPSRWTRAEVLTGVIVALGTVTIVALTVALPMR